MDAVDDCKEGEMDRAHIEQRAAKALEFHDRNFNCAQSVACSCCDLAGLDEATAFRMMEGFGGGMGRFTETCGALSGVVALVSFAQSVGPHNPTTKRNTYAIISQLVDAFERENGSTLCGHLTGHVTGTKLQDCPKLIQDGVRLTAECLGAEEA